MYLQDKGKYSTVQLVICGLLVQWFSKRIPGTPLEGSELTQRGLLTLTAYKWNQMGFHLYAVTVGIALRGDLDLRTSLRNTVLSYILFTYSRGLTFIYSEKVSRALAYRSRSIRPKILRMHTTVYIF